MTFPWVAEERAEGAEPFAGRTARVTEVPIGAIGVGRTPTWPER
ncbi:hypothetical protein OG520_03210 [Streptomyces sp. NBC_00984]|nr:hypothetical protein OG520_03210 [Streptomyces sp. NBC_00984]